MDTCKHDWYFYENMNALKCTRCGKTTTPVIRAATNEPKVLHAFPNPHRTDELGMPLRDYFAAKAMQALIIANGPAPTGGWPTHAERTAYTVADAMLKAREA